MGLLDGLAKMGIKNVDTKDIYETEKEKNSEKKKIEEVKSVPVVEEKDFIFEKSYECIICDNKYKSYTLKSNKAKLIKLDRDLRPVFEGVEPLKFEVVTCPVCGYSVMSRYMIPLTPSQKKAVVENVCQSFTGIKEDSENTVTYESALEKMKLALACAILKRAKASEKAYICLKGGWLCRAYAEHITEETPDKMDKLSEIRADEKEFLDSAYEGFVAARQSENFPIAGMDATTLDYLIAVLATDRNQLDVASKMIAGILQSPNASTKMKDKARVLKDELVVKIKEAKK